MDVQATEPRRGEDRSRKNAPVCDDQRDIRAARAKLVGECIGANLRRLGHVDAALEREALHRRRGELHPAAARSIGLCHHENDLGDVDERAERWHRELRRTEEDGARRSGASRRRHSAA